MSATDTLREDHKLVLRLNKVIIKCYEALYDGKLIRFSDIDKIIIIISEFLDAIHHYREEGSYFACVSGYGTFQDEIRAFLIEHEFGQRIAIQIKKHLKRWKDGEDAREPVARFLRTYSIYLDDHMSKEEKFFDKVEKEVLSKEEEQEMHEQFNYVVAVTTKIDEMIKEIEYLEQQSWYTN